ncbi:MAG: hypothetical protein M1826_005053 [Phylliscum demangeonii]|nr:MAG: hypothetical protein M1826_005053 [Phylliscum demangeonii]
MRPAASGRDGFVPERSRKPSVVDGAGAGSSSTAYAMSTTSYRLMDGGAMAAAAVAVDPSPSLSVSSASASASASPSPAGSAYDVRSLGDTLEEGTRRTNEDVEGGGGGETEMSERWEEEPEPEPEPELDQEQDQKRDGQVHPATPAVKDTLLDPRVSFVDEASSEPASVGPPHDAHRAPLPSAALRRLLPLIPFSRTLDACLPGSPRSLSSKSMRSSSKNDDSDSLVDETASQAIVSSEEDEVDARAERAESTPQFIMPSIRIPSRRPFTDRGKQMGRLKVLLVGEAGVGKTSLIESIVQACEDIVHVDPISSEPRAVAAGKGRRRRASRTRHTTEIYASTKPYPAWWSELDDSRGQLRRRKSYGDSILERNLCFVDTAGYAPDGPSSKAMDGILRYVESQRRRAMPTDGVTDGDLMNLLSGNGGPQVDAVFFLVAKELTRHETRLLQRLSRLTNIIPVVPKTDVLGPERTASLKTSVLQQLQALDVPLFRCGRSIDGGGPFATSAAHARDSDTMDASVLMSPDYVQPLVGSELHTLIERVFERDAIACLRHTAATKLILARHHPPPPTHRSRTSLASSVADSTPSSPSASSGSLVPSSSPASLASPWSGPGSAPALGEHELAPMQMQTQTQTEMPAQTQARLARWATQLHRSMQNERARFQALVRGERALWRTAGLGEYVVDDGTRRAVESRPSDHHDNNDNDDGGAACLSLVRRHPPPHERRRTDDVDDDDEDNDRAARATPILVPVVPIIDPIDPLRLLRYRSALRHQAWLALQMLSGLGLVGGLAWWLSHHLPPLLPLLPSLLLPSPSPTHPQQASSYREWYAHLCRLWHRAMPSFLSASSLAGGGGGGGGGRAW